MIINENVHVLDVGDPFSHNDLRGLNDFKLHYPDEVRASSDFGLHFIDHLFPAHLLREFGDRLLFGLDVFELDETDKPQDLHFDFFMGQWGYVELSGLIVFGIGTGKTAVPDAFEYLAWEDWNPFFNEARAIARRRNIIGHKRVNREIPTGHLIHSNRPILHGRGTTFPGTRVAIDFIATPFNNRARYGE